jgi:hypothetical protein
LTQATPLRPHASVAFPALQVLPTQQPAQVCAHPWLGTTHCPLVQAWPDGHAEHAAPPPPHAEDSEPVLQTSP